MVVTEEEYGSEGGGRGKVPVSIDRDVKVLVLERGR